MNIRDLNLPDYTQTILIRMTLQHRVTEDERKEVERDYAKLFSLRTPSPPIEEIEALLERDGSTHVVQAQRIIRQWHAMKIHHTPAYRIVHHMGATPYPPNEDNVHSAMTEMLVTLEAEGDDLHLAREERALKNVIPDDVIAIWHICQTHGIAPWTSPAVQPLIVEHVPQG